MKVRLHAHARTHTQVTLAFHFSMWSAVMALMAGQRAVRHKAGVIFQNNAKRNDGRRRASHQPRRKSHSLGVLERFALSFSAFHSSVTGETLASTHGGSSLARRINHQCLSNLHCLFMREITFVFPVKMKGGKNKEVAN